MMPTGACVSVTPKGYLPPSGVRVGEGKHMDAEAHLTPHLSQMCDKFSRRSVCVCVSVDAGVHGLVHVEARDSCWVSSSVSFQTGPLTEPSTHRLAPADWPVRSKDSLISALLSSDSVLGSQMCVSKSGFFFFFFMC